jgi:hypothetical protein
MKIRRGRRSAIQSGYLINAIFSVVLSGCASHALFQKPNEASNPIRIPPVPESKFTLVASIPYDAAKAAVNTIFASSIPIGAVVKDGLCGEYPTPGIVRQCEVVSDVDLLAVPPRIGSRKRCDDVPGIVNRRACADYDWHASIDREGQVALSRAGNTMQIARPLHVVGQAGVRGDLAGIFSLSAKKFEARLTQNVDLTFGLDERWCPVIGATTTANWVSTAPVEVIGRSCTVFNLAPLGEREACVGRANMDITNEVNKALLDRQSDLLIAVRSAMPCATVISAVSAQWHTFSFPVDIPDSGPLFLNIRPASAGIGGLILERDRLKLEIQVGASTLLEENGIGAQNVPLPPLQHIDSKSSHLAVSLQLSVPYKRFENAFAADLKGRDFTNTTSAGTMRVHVEEVTVYPSKQQLVIGLKVNAKAPRSIFDTRGWIYFLGEPVLVDGNNAIQVRNLGFAPVADNDFWTLTKGILQEQILAKLNERSTIDLRSMLNQTEQNVGDAINNSQAEGLSYRATATSVKLNNLTLGEANIVAAGSLLVDFEVTIAESIVAK